MKTKDEILQDNDVSIDRWPDTKKLILDSMDKYAEQQAILFKDWCEEGNECRLCHEEQRTIPTKELYFYFLQEQNKK